MWPGYFKKWIYCMCMIMYNMTVSLYITFRITLRAIHFYTWTFINHGVYRTLININTVYVFIISVITIRHCRYKIIFCSFLLFFLNPTKNKKSWLRFLVFVHRSYHYCHQTALNVKNLTKSYTVFYFERHLFSNYQSITFKHFHEYA